MNGLAIGINPEASDVGQSVAASRPYCRLLLAWAAATLSIPNGDAATGRISRYAAPPSGPCQPPCQQWIGIACLRRRTNQPGRAKAMLGIGQGVIDAFAMPATLVSLLLKSK